MRTGIVMWYDKHAENGIIKETDTGLKWYFDISVIKNRTPLKARERVAFEHNEAITTCRCAMNIQVILEDDYEDVCEHQDDTECGHCIDCGEYVGTRYNEDGDQSCMDVSTKYD